MAGGSGFWRAAPDTGAPAGAMEVIGHIALGAAAANIDFPDIQTTFESLMIVGQLRSTDTVSDVWTGIRFNGDTGANYAYQELYGSGSSSGGGTGSGQSSGRVASVPAASAPANLFSPFKTTIPGYRRTVQKTLTTESARFLPSAPAAILAMAHWSSTAPIDRITIISTTGNLAAGSHATIYGLKGAVA